MTARSNMMRLFRAYCSQQINQLIEDNQPSRIRAIIFWMSNFSFFHVLQFAIWKLWLFNIHTLIV